jgi:deoxyadenosine/deoxycytidine kinase
MEQHYIVVEGPLGVGKTSLAKRLSERLNGQLLLEDLDENPFLPGFYKDPKNFRFKAQIYFLLRRFQQASEVNQINLFERVVISDYLFQKDRLFATTNLDDGELWLYDQLFNLLRPRVAMPDLVIFLQARTEVLMDRIRSRGRKYERAIGADYVDRINRAFNDFFFHYDDSPLLVINASEIDFVHVPADLDDLVEKIKKMKKGTQYYVPLSVR